MNDGQEENTDADAVPAPAPAAAEPEEQEALDAYSRVVTGVVEKVGPAVVSVYVEKG